MISACSPPIYRYTLAPDSPCREPEISPGSLYEAATEAAQHLPLVDLRLPDETHGLAVQSYPGDGDPTFDQRLVASRRSYVYDNAIVAIAFIQLGKIAEAEAILATLESIQSPDGSFGFSFNTAMEPYYDQDYVRTGTVAWVGYAFVYHLFRTQNPRFLAAALRVADFLVQMQVDAPQDPRDGLLRGGRGVFNRRHTALRPDVLIDEAIAEHQFDAWFFLDLLAHVHPETQWVTFRDRLGQRIEAALWLPKDGRFATAVNQNGPIYEWALDSSGSYGVLFWHARVNLDNANEALRTTYALFSATDNGLNGFRPYAGTVSDYPDIDWNDQSPIFVEGTMTVALAATRVGNRNVAEEALRLARQLMCITGGALPYATHTQPDFPAVTAAAPTAWFILAALAFSGHEGAWPIWSTHRPDSTTPKAAPPPPHPAVNLPNQG
ncbi:MAG: hypothetical protein HUU55_18725 [Myxococcales bacterium]|nr:hypothetical protein [Myxococcales bacterium]